VQNGVKEKENVIMTKTNSGVNSIGKVGRENV
jgi:hypothetical protein